jgi:DNA-binding transcriptional LysR family regulator
MACDLNDTMIFMRVAEHGSFIAASRSLRLPKSTVSRRVMELELCLGAQLLHRTTRKLGLTEAGHLYFRHCQRIARDLDDAESAVGKLQDGPRGWLRVAASYEIGTELIAPLRGELRRRYPEMRLEIVLEAFNSSPLDLIEQEIDVAIRVGKLPDSNLAARRLAVLGTHVYATQAYLDAHGQPEHPDDLRRHHTLAMAKHDGRGAGYAWSLQNGTQCAEFPIDPDFVANDPAGIRVAMLADEGLMLAGDIMVKRYANAGTVRRVLPDWRGPDFDLNLVFPRGRVQSPKVRAFVDFLVDRLDLDAEVGNHKAQQADNC